MRTDVLAVATAFLGMAGVEAGTGPLALWHGDGNAADSAGALDGTLLNGASFGPAIAQGIPGQSFLLDGADDEVHFPSPPAGTLDGGLTLAAWIQTSGTADFSGILTKFGPGNLPLTGFQMSMSGNNGFPPNRSGIVRSDLGTGSSYVTAFNLRTVADGTPHHLALTCDGRVAILHVDGEPGDPVPAEAWVRDNGRDFVLGNDPAVGGRHFNGLVDEVAIYPRALTTAEVQALAGRPLLQVVPASPGLATVSWPGTLQGFRLQSNPALASTGWTDVPGGSASPVTVETGDAARFFRLAKP